MPPKRGRGRGTTTRGGRGKKHPRPPHGRGSTINASRTRSTHGNTPRRVQSMRGHSRVIRLTGPPAPNVMYQQRMPGGLFAVQQARYPATSMAPQQYAHYNVPRARPCTPIYYPTQPRRPAQQHRPLSSVSVQRQATQPAQPYAHSEREMLTVIDPTTRHITGERFAAQALPIDDDVSSEECMLTTHHERSNYATEYDDMQYLHDTRSPQSGIENDLSRCHDDRTSKLWLSSSSSDGSAELGTSDDELILNQESDRRTLDCKTTASERQVLVHAENGKCEKDLIHLLFSNKDKYNGGPIQEVDIGVDSTTALITFDEKHDADNVLEREEVVFMGRVFQASKPVLTTIKLSNVPARMTDDMLELLLEQHHGSAFSLCPDISIDERTREAIITFGNAAEAEKMVECQTVEYKKTSMKVEKVILPTIRNSAEAIPSVTHLHDEIDALVNYYQDNVADRQVLISGIDENCDEDMVQLIFANKNRSGGGPIQATDSDKEKGTVLITYEEQKDAANVLAKEDIVIFGLVVKASRPPRVVQDDNRVKVKMTNIPPNSVERDIELLLRKHSGSKDCRVKIELDRLRGFAFVTFPDSTAADVIRKCKELRLKGSTIKIEYGQEDVVAQETAAFKSRVISVMNLPKDDDTTSVKLLFENKQRSGGGPIESFVCVEEGFHVITFTSATDALNVYEYSLKGGIEWKGQPLTVHLLDPLQGNHQSHAITVENLDPTSTSKEMLTLYFESAKSSNGGPVNSIVVREDGKSAVVCFSEREDAERVAKKQTHLLNKIHLHVTSLRPRPPPPSLKGPIEACMLFLWGIPCSADAKAIRMFVEDAAECNLQNISFAVEPGKAMLLFDKDPNYSALRENCTRYPMLDQMVQVERVPQSRSIQVVGVSNTLQILELYFENTKRSEGGEVESSKEYNDYAIITFKDKTTLDSVLARDHTLNEQKLVIRKYFACLGVLRPDHDDSPGDIQMIMDDQAVLAFLLQASRLRQAIEVHLRAVGCQVTWPEKADGTLILQCTLNGNTDGFHRASKEWECQVNQRIDNILSKLSSENVTIVSEIWNQFQAKTIEVIKNQDSERLAITLSESDSSCTIAGEKTRVKEVLDELEEMVKVVMKEHEFAHRTITDKVQLKEFWQKLILIGPVLAKINKNYPKVRIGFVPLTSTALRFEGRYAETQEAKKHVQSLLHDIPRRVITVSATTKTLLNGKVSKEQIMGRMNGRRLVLEASDQVRGVCVYTVDEADLEIGIKAIHDVIKEHTMNVRAGKEQELGRILTDFERRFNGNISYELNDNLLELSVSWEAEKEVIAKIDSIVQAPMKQNQHFQ